MKIAIVGATGLIGSAIYKEAVSRKIKTLAVVRDEAKSYSVLGGDADILAKNIGNLLTEDLKGYDVIVNAYSDRSEFERMYDTYLLLSHYAKQNNAKLVQLVGAASMKMPDGRILLDHLVEKEGELEWLGEAKVGKKILDNLKKSTDLNWVAVSPDMDIYVGEKSKYKIIGDGIEFAKNKKAQVSTENYASGIIDEIQKPTVKNARFSVMDI